MFIQIIQKDILELQVNPIYSFLFFSFVLGRSWVV